MVYDRRVPGTIRTLQLKVSPRDPVRPNYPVVTILIDGEDVLGQLNGGFMGFDPADILDSGALLPNGPPRRVAVYRCSCGEAGCGCVAPLIAQLADRVRWSDFRDFTGVYNSPLDDPEPTGGSVHALPDLEFDAAEYRQEVERAAADRGWETAERRTARLLFESLARIDLRFAEQGYWRGWVAPHWNEPGKFHVEFIGPRGQVLVALVPTAGTPEEQADEMAQFMLSTEPDQWNIEVRHEWPPDQVSETIAARRAARDTQT